MKLITYLQFTEKGEMMVWTEAETEESDNPLIEAVGNKFMEILRDVASPILERHIHSGKMFHDNPELMDHMLRAVREYYADDDGSYRESLPEAQQEIFDQIIFGKTYAEIKNIEADIHTDDVLETNEFQEIFRRLRESRDSSTSPTPDDTPRP
jgi:hypothetical protein